MKRSLLLLLLFQTFLFSQQSKKVGDVTVFESKEFKEKEKSDYVISFDQTKTGKTIVLRGAKKKLILDVFDERFDKTHTEFIKRGKAESCFGGFFSGSELKFFSVVKPKKRERILYCHTFSLNGNSYSKKELFRKTMSKGGSLFYSRRNRETNFATSPNEQYFVIASDNSTKRNNSSTIHVYDMNTLELVYSKAFQEHDKNYYKHSSLAIDNDGNVYSLGEMRFGKKRGGAEYKYILNKISKVNNQELILDLDELHVRSLTIANATNNIDLYGFYAEKYEGRIKGGCSFKIDMNSFSLIRSKVNPLPLQVYHDLYGEKRGGKKKKKAKELKNFYADYVLEDEEEGATYLLAEEFYITTTYVMNANGGGYTVSTPHYDDVLILKFNKDGDLEWGRSIYKKAKKPSYNAFLKNHKLHVVLNTGRNLQEQKNGRTKLSRGVLGIGATALYDFTYASNGEVKRNKIQDNKVKGATKYQPYLGAYQNEKFMMMNYMKRKRRFMVLE